MPWSRSSRLIILFDVLIAVGFPAMPAARVQDS
jgi:hypothetical protein